MDYKDLSDMEKRIVQIIENIFLANRITRKDFVTALAFLINKYKFKRKK
jgi:hypothetical protein